MAKDRIGNEIKNGDLVQVTLDSIMQFGKVVEISDGGVIVGKGDKLTLGSVRVTLDIAAQFDPRDQCAAGLVKVHDPDATSKPSLSLMH